MNARVGVFGFGRSVKTVFFDSKETRLEKVIRRSYKLKNRWAPEFLEVSLEDAEPLLLEESDLKETTDRLEAGQEGSCDADGNS